MVILYLYRYGYILSLVSEFCTRKRENQFSSTKYYVVIAADTLAILAQEFIFSFWKSLDSLYRG